MIWLTWRLHRAQLVVLAGVALVASFVLLRAGQGIADAYTAAGLASCGATPAGCGDLQDAFMRPYDGLVFFVPLFLAFPAVLGMLWGAPLVAREFEQGTHRLAWTQSVTRTRWLLGKAAVILGATVAVTALLTLAVHRWSGPLFLATDERFLPGFFDLRGVVPIGYAVFAVALGIALGTVLRRTVAAAGLTLLAFGAVRALVMLAVRPRFAQAVTLVTPFSADEPRRGLQDWQMSVTTIDAAGRVVGEGLSLNVDALGLSCPGLDTPGLPDFDKVQACVAKAGVVVERIYHPGDRYWSFQWIEFGLFLGLAALALGIALVVIRRRSA